MSESLEETTPRVSSQRPISQSIEATADSSFILELDKYSIEKVVEMKISRFLDQLGSFHPENLHELIIGKVEKPLIAQVLKRVGGNQVHAARVLGINRNTLRKKMKIYNLMN